MLGPSGPVLFFMLIASNQMMTAFSQTSSPSPSTLPPPPATCQGIVTANTVRSVPGLTPLPLTRKGFQFPALNYALPKNPKCDADGKKQCLQQLEAHFTSTFSLQLGSPMNRNLPISQQKTHFAFVCQMFDKGDEVLFQINLNFHCYDRASSTEIKSSHVLPKKGSASRYFQSYTCPK